MTSAADDRAFVDGVAPLRRLRAVLVALAVTFEREMELGRGALWLPVLFGAGVLVYFGLPAEPSLPLLVVLAAGAVAAAVLARNHAALFRLVVVVAAVIAGTMAMTARTAMVAAPILAAEDTAILSGWIEELERQGPSEVRAVIRVQSIEGLPAAATPERVRISIRGAFEARIGDEIEGLVGLQPPPAPVMPGGYDFGRDLFYDGIGGSGFSYGPPDVVDLGPPPAGLRLWAPVEHLRAAIGARIEGAIPGDNGQIANALTTGDRGGISDAANDVLRLSGLSHILSISGLHMALVAGAAFWFLRALLALSPALALRRPIKKWAAAGALGIATGYLLISGFDVATQRSYIMLAVMLAAVLLDRRAFSVRNVALAAGIILLMTPEAVLSASFQMSFAATLALVAGFEAVAERQRRRIALGDPNTGRWARIALAWIAGLFLTSLLAGLATTPFSAFHFQRTSPLSLVANLMAGPFVSILIMPAALAAVLLMPLGLEALPLKIMDFGLRIVIDIAELVSGWTGTGGLVPMAPVASILLVSAGLCWLCLWRLRWRLLGVVPIVAGIALAGTLPRPAVIVDETGTAMMVRGSDGAYSFLGSGGTFERETWLRADADMRGINDPTLREGVSCDPLGCTALLGDTGLRVALTRDARAFTEDCRLAAVVVSELTAPADCGAAVVIDGPALARFGAHAVLLGEAGDGTPAFKVETVRPQVRRPWMPPLPPELQ